jgi:TP901 family phage tail tape measure protein
MTALNNLLFKVSLLDAMSGPAKNIMSNMDRVTTRIQGGFNKIGYGAAGLAGAAYSLDNILQPAKDMQTALGEISSMNVGQDVLNGLNSAALKFSVKYGESAAEFVRSAYDIQGAISGLSGNELPAFTNASAILAKGTKADMGTITNYVGTMYGIFQKNADAMGKANWINMMAGQTAVAVNIFKTTGQGMSEAFTTLGAGAQTMGVGMAEQMSILGTLQATMSGSEAGTKYRAFLDGVGNAQDKLGLKFTDAQGKMLPMVNILEKIKGKYGAIDTVAESDLLKKAFGTQEATALVKLLSTNIDGLSNSINEVGKQTGLQGAIDMANAMVQPWEQAKSAGNALMIMLGQKMLPVLKPVFNGIIGISEKLMRWMELFPNITTYIGYAVFAVIGIIAALSALSVAVGISQFLLVGWGAGAAVFKGALWLLKGGLFNVIPAVWSFSAALLANPITWIVLGIVALIGVIAAAVIYWDTWTQAVISFTSKWLELIGVFALVDSAIAGWEVLKGWWQSFKEWISALNPFEIVGKGIDWLIDKINMIPGINIATSGATNPALDKMATPPAITGPQTAAPTLSAMAAQPKWLQQPSPGLLTNGFAQQQTPALSALSAQPKWTQQPAPGLLTDGFAPPQPVAAPAALTQSQNANVPKGGIMSQINNADNSKSVSVGGITVNNYGQPVTGQRLADEIAMAAG